MPKIETSWLRMRFIRKTEAAVLVTGRTGPADRAQKEYWMPRSLMGTTRTSKDIAHPENYDVIDFSLPDWKVEQDDLHAFVTS